MTNKILKSILSAVIAVLFTSLVIITGVLYRYFGTLQEDQLKDQLSLAASATEQLGKPYLEGLDSSRYRLTWVDTEGTVIYDSHAEAADMENHAGREEIREAFLSGKGSCVRQSATLTEQTIYEAVRLKDGSVLRLSVSRATAFRLILGMLQPIAITLVISLVFSVWLARRMAKRIVEPLNRLDLDNPMDNDCYEELSPLLHRIHSQHIRIESQIHTLQHKQREFEQITGNMKEALILLDDSCKILSINPAAIVLFDTNSSCIGADFLIIDRMQDMRRALEKTLEQGFADFRANKKGRDYQFNLSRINADSNHHGIVILAFDITDQVNAENHRREFTANVSHELKTPLQSIVGSAELMENGIVKAEDVPRFVGHIRREASRLVFLIDDIIRLSQLDEGSEMPMEEVPLKSMSEDICGLLSDAAALKDISMEVIGNECTICGVRRLLHEVIYNLCDNAIKYNNVGGSVKIFITPGEADVRISVQDTGIGISPEHREKIFERFYRVDKSHSKQSGGTGLGLSIVKHAVLRHHGRIEVDSELGAGTTISVIIPRDGQ